MSDRIFVSTRKGLFTFARGESGWAIQQTAFVGDNVTLVLPDRRDGSVYAALDHGHFGVKMQRSRDGGGTWEECATPAYPEPPEGWKPATTPMGDSTAPWKLIKIWSLAPGGADQPGTLWAGTIPGGLFRSDDGGDSWALNRPLWDHPGRAKWFGGGEPHPGIHSLNVHPNDPATVRASVSCGGTWVTTDGGDSWNNTAHGMWAAYMPPDHKDDVDVQDPHLVVQCAASPDHLWCQHHNGMFRSTDGGTSWTELKGVEPSNFGFTVAVHPTDPNTAWFVPAIKDEKRIPVDGKVVVTRTRDGGETFETLREGLPQEHAYDLVFRHGLDVDSTGDVLAMGSTTGSVWVTENQGDAWQCLTSNLPQIYSVRFGS
jgi:photosystem II stability/assembly factor-like uncharacterized protein